MDKPISAGDLVVVVRTCCETKWLGHGGKTFVAVVGYSTNSRCPFCGRTDMGVHFGKGPNAPGAPLWWLKRIPPLDELESEKRDEEITA